MRPRKFRLPGARQILLKSYVDYHPEFPNALEGDPRVLLVQEISGYKEVEASLKVARDRLVVADCAFIRQAREDGLVSLRETALKMVLAGVVSFQEAISATPAPYHRMHR